LRAVLRQATYGNLCKCAIARIEQLHKMFLPPFA
jgi:hypothetical protein